MKKVLSIFLILSLCATLFACGAKITAEPNETTATTEGTTAPVSEPTTVVWEEDFLNEDEYYFEEEEEILP